MSVNGKWQIVVNSPVGRQEAICEFEAEGAVLTGKCYSNDVVVEIQDGVVAGNQVKFVCKIKQPMPMKLSYTLVINGDKISGEVKPGLFPKQAVTGVRL
ncbi:hypothetical protein ACWT_5941 [Actinoplanes sp. SE50]|uniref:hypothetical protein n=1 Tax=unclassified Actinoplanes TaxID=2626549 RepID=UPI00023EC16D|nr:MULTISPECIES: hypothetical protein [unclassified Actinoplanes]AEV86960.1 hypothetical protein ACPL_6073 [Actinoplanes sp. SE50/110]ATO85356.1 hypothetical protein ACWT_5941 [Actinoplanes sp. SE50]SLM02768.1 hypothetical protein ACSP50_6053 [Actinoplanes sp. SE50/110]